MQERSLSFEAALNDLANLLHQIAIAQTVPQSIADDLPERAALLNLAQTLSAETVQLYYQIVLLGRRDIGLAPDEYAGFTMTLLRMLAFTPTEKSLMSTTEATKTNITPANKPTATTTVASIEITEKPIQNIQEYIPENIPKNIVKNPNIIEHAPEANIHKASEAAIMPSSNFDGNWRKLVEQNLKLGLARALAQNCELLSYDEDSLHLRVASSQKHLVSASYQDKLSNAINEYFGRKIRLNIEVASDAQAEIVTPAKQNANEKAVIQSGAEAAIMNDDFVKALINDLGAQIIPNSIKPIQSNS
jgi:DNA polymerase III subunit gamma/tau